MEMPELNLPLLPARYDTALRAAMKFLFAEFAPFAVIVSGSVARGNPDPGSDLDLLVLHEQPWCRRVQQWFEGVPAEIFVNSAAWMERYLLEEAADGRPVMTHMMATGSVIYSASAKTAELIGRARGSLAKGPSSSELALLRQRYAAACLFEDAFELAARDEAGAALLLGRAVSAALEYWFASRQRFLVRAKERLAVVRAEDPEVAMLVERALLEATLTLRVVAARELARKVLGAKGFFAWDSGPS